MDRRQRKTRNSIFNAFITLLAQKDFAHITVGEIIDAADIGRATFYSHFETKDFLLKELCAELFCHILDAQEENNEHKHIFACDAPDSVFLHLFQHLQRRYFKENLVQLVESRLPLFESKKREKLPDSFWINHITSTFVETIRWWVDNGKQESPETITKYFMLAL